MRAWTANSRGDGGPKDRHKKPAAPLALIILPESYPGLTAGPIHCRPFGPLRKRGRKSFSSGEEFSG
ncbi:MAG: hypothetical protein DMG10_20140 [Acidobacteria bacterium]|nr:MAG: hypothetical protein DMG10_20140 [Acidobacteriota bacterium]